MPNSLPKNSGFTLLETFGAITILILAVLGPLTLLATSISDSAIVKNQLTAAYLAQEGVELVIRQRDIDVDDPTLPNAVDWLLHAASGRRLDTICSGPNSCDIDAANHNPFACTDKKGCQLYQDSDGRFYTPDPTNLSSFTGTTTIFWRKITVVPVNVQADAMVTLTDPFNNFAEATYFQGPEAAKVTVEVSWSFKGIPKKYSLATYIYNHKVFSAPPTTP